MHIFYETIPLPGVSLSVTRYVPLNVTGLNDTLVVLVHGFPDTSLGWRRVAGQVCKATNLQVVVPDMRGYGSTKLCGNQHDDDEAYCFEKTCDDLVALLDALGQKDAVFIGHDFGGSVVWALANHSELESSKCFKRVKAVGSFCTPYFVPNPESNPWPKMVANPGRFEYQLYFQTERAVREFEMDTEKTIRCMIRSWDDEIPTSAMVSMFSPLSNNGMLVGFSKEGHPRSTKVLTEIDLARYADAFARSGFLNPMRWYRNVERNWKWNNECFGIKITAPALMVTAGKDVILTPSMTKGMEVHVPNLRRAHIEDAGHWVLMEKPEECARILVDFLESFLSIDKEKKKKSSKL